MEEKLSNQKFFAVSYKERDFSKQDMSGSDFICCNFDDADLTDANCSNCDFTGSTMRRTKCTRTNFMNSQLGTIFHPSDCYGMTLTLSCKTFQAMKISKQWWYGWLYFAMQMTPELEKGKDLRDNLRAMIGTDRFARLKEMFRTRQL